MPYEYRVVPAPRKGQKAKTARTGEERFALALTTLMNQLAEDGWEYVRAETLPAEERSGFTGRTVVTHNLLVFRREKEEAPVTFADPAFRADPGPRLSAERHDEPRLAAIRSEPPITLPRLGPAREESGH